MLLPPMPVYHGVLVTETGFLHPKGIQFCIKLLSGYATFYVVTCIYKVSKLASLSIHLHKVVTFIFF